MSNKDDSISFNKLFIDEKLRRVFDDSNFTVGIGALLAGVVSSILLYKDGISVIFILVWFSLALLVSFLRVYNFNHLYVLLKSYSYEKVKRLEKIYMLSNVVVSILWSVLFFVGLTYLKNDYALLILTIALGWVSMSITSSAVDSRYFITLNGLPILGILLGVLNSNIELKNFAFLIASTFSIFIIFSSFRYRDMFFNQNKKRYEAIKLRNGIVESLGKAGEYRDEETGEHINRMSHSCYLLAKELGKDEEYCRLIKSASVLHDVGKIGIPDSILLKPGKLTEEEYEKMKEHPRIGMEIIGDKDDELSKMARLISYCHHERWDGNGYPNGLSGRNIPYEARIAMISDVYDALRSNRPYKKRWSLEDAKGFMKENSGKMFDPDMLNAFLEILDEVESYGEELSGSTQ